MQKSCTQCSQAFEITDRDLAFYDKVSPVFNGKKELIPPPTLCPECRKQRRYSFRNEWSLYHRKCDRTGRQIVAIYSPEKPYTVYDQALWWSDVYDPFSYGRDIDFSRSFFEQFHALNQAVPKAAIQNANSVNSEYTNYSGENKNAYLVVGSFNLEDCLFCYRCNQCSDLVDCYDLNHSELCYECSQGNRLYRCTYCRECDNCSECQYCEDCVGCTNCFGCVNLRNKQFYIYNTPFTEEQYKQQISVILAMKDAAVLQDIHRLQHEVPRRCVVMNASENCEGDQLFGCERCTQSFILKSSQDCRFCEIAGGITDSYDTNFADHSELQYESTNLHENYCVCFGVLVWYCKNSFYNVNCFNSSNLFGCSGMKGATYCIFNKQYTQKEYEELVPRLIHQMRERGEWGQFFPANISPFSYNETVAQEHYPLTKEEVLQRGWKWHDEEEKKDQYMGPAAVVPHDIIDVSDDITKQILTCEITSKPYKIIPQELKFYREMSIPIPRKCPDQRHKERMALRNPRKLWNRTCAKCAKAIQTTYAPERPEIVYCERCYLETVY